MDKYKQPDQVMVREVADELVLVHTETERYFSLDPTGRIMYELLVAGATVDQVVERIVKTMEGATPDTVRNHLTQLIERLSSSALLERV